MTKPFMPAPVAVLPREARDMLVAASQVKDERARRIAVDAAIDYAKIRFPHYFIPTQPIKE